MSKRNPLEAELNAALYAAAEKAGFAAVLRRYHGEVWVSTYQAETRAYFAIDAEIVNADHECDIPVPAALDIAVARAEKWLGAYCARKHPAVIA